ncbi:Na+/H+ antiporter NhaA [bacterium]|nr:Na+/H+ antiporter NhaA [bacterium]
MTDAAGDVPLSREALGGLVLIGATVLALVAANSPMAGLYQTFLDLPISVGVGAKELAKPLIFWVNDGLMAVFFLTVGLELKYEMLEGKLRDPRAVILPGMAALGGMACPALVYLALTAGAGVTSGWAIPTATDIAFALGVLALAGPGLPVGLRSFLLTLAILDDLGAILIIAIFYGHDLDATYLLAAVVPVAAMLVLARMKVASLAPAVVLGVVLWLLVLKSGIHATLAGVVMAFCIPLKDRKGGAPLHHLAEVLQPWVTFLIVPLFAFANAGLPLGNLSMAGQGGQIALGVGLGLLAGKFVGVLGVTWLLVKLRAGTLPLGMGWTHMMAVGLLAGIGFTMSLFIGGLAFGEGAEMNAVRLGVLAASVLAAGLGLVSLRRLARRKPSGHARAASL